VHFIQQGGYPVAVVDQVGVDILGGADVLDALERVGAYPASTNRSVERQKALACSVSTERYSSRRAQLLQVSVILEQWFFHFSD